MNSNITILILLIAFTMLSHVVADNPPVIAANEWQQDPSGIALAVFYKTEFENGTERHDALYLYIKNTSNIQKYFDYSPFIGVKIYYINGDGTKVPLSDYSDRSGGVATANVAPLSIAPGAIIAHRVELTSSELLVVKSRPISCQIEISDQALTSHQVIESTPKLLSSGP